MSFEFSKHADEQIAARKIPRSVVDSVLAHPQQIVPETSTKDAYQSKVEMDGKEYLVRVIVANDVNPKLVVTAYRTSRIEKYWRES